MTERVTLICKALSEKKGADIKVIEISKISSIADYFVICSGTSTTQVKALSESVQEKMEKEDFFALRKEGESEGRWIAIDYSDIIVHIFHTEARENYCLDRLWTNGNNVTIYTDDGYLEVENVKSPIKKSAKAVSTAKTESETSNDGVEVTKTRVARKPKEKVLGEKEVVKAVRTRKPKTTE
ncbi:MAG: ribosome silencing factor [Clostridia bacterium]